MIWWTSDPHRKDQAAIVSEPLRSIKQMASYWDLKWLKQVEPNDPVNLNNSTADVCFAHIFFSREGPTFGRISSYFRIAGTTLYEDIPVGCIKWSASCDIRHVFFAGMPKDYYVKLFSPPWYVWCYGHMKENIVLQSVWAGHLVKHNNMKSENLCYVWIYLLILQSEPMDMFSACTLQSTGFVWISRS